MQVDTDLTPDDYRAFVKYVCARPWYMRLLGFGMWTALWCALGLMLLVAIQLLVRPALHTSNGSELLLFLAIAGALLGVVVAYLRQLRRRALPSRDGVALGKRTYRLSDDGVHETAAHTDSLTRWSAVQAVRETEQHLFIMLDSNIAHIVPKRSFASLAALEQFKDLVAARAVAAGLGDGPPSSEQRARFGET